MDASSPNQSIEHQHRFIEHQPSKLMVAGSNPAPPTIPRFTPPYGVIVMDRIYPLYPPNNQTSASTAKALPAPQRTSHDRNDSPRRTTEAVLLHSGGRPGILRETVCVSGQISDGDRPEGGIRALASASSNECGGHPGGVVCRACKQSMLRTYICDMTDGHDKDPDSEHVDLHQNHAWRGPKRTNLPWYQVAILAAVSLSVASAALWLVDYFGGTR